MKQLLSDKMDTLGKIAEIKRIFTVVEKSLNDQNHACVVVTSGEKGEGKTIITAGLAVSAAEKNGSRVLAVDYNWHTPALHDYFGIKMFNSMDAINSDKSIAEMVCNTGWENLDVLPAVQNFQGSENVDGWYLNILHKAKESYDYVFVDTSSVFPINYRKIDPVLISNMASGVVLVALTNVTPKQVLKRTSIAMETSGASLLGVVANQWKNPLV